MTFAFTSLPDSVLLRVQQLLLGDIRSHVTLAKTCSKLRNLYNDDEVWRRVCFGAGFGRPLVRGDPVNQPAWRRIAHILLNHPVRCEIRSCKDAHLDFGASPPFSVLTRPYYYGIDRVTHQAEYFHVASRTSVQIQILPEEGVVFHPLFYYLHHNQPAPGAFDPVLDIISILHTLLPTFPESRAAQYGPLCWHPNASCAFLTCPPTKTISLPYGDGSTLLTITNPDGCTILDVNRALADL